MKHIAGNTEKNYRCGGSRIRRNAMAVVIAAASVLSCTKTDISSGDAGVPDNSIPRMNFSPSASAMTKGLLTPDNFNIEGTQIKVNDMFTTHEDIWSVDGEDKEAHIETYIDDQIAEYRPVIESDGTVSLWNFVGKDYYWTVSGTHYFSAYSWKYNNGVRNICLTDCLTVNESAKSDNETSDNDTFADGLTYNPRLSTITIKNWTLSKSKQFDFCYAVNSRSMDETDPYRPVELEMQHLFAAVQFNITNLIPGEDVTFNSLYVYNMLNKGSVVIMHDGTLNDMQFSNSGDAFSVTPDEALDFNETYNAFADSNKDNDNMIGTDGCILIWPHNSTQLQDVKANISTSENGSKDFSLFIEDNIEQWRAGYRYIYNIEITDRKISISATVVPWVTDDVVLED